MKTLIKSFIISLVIVAIAYACRKSVETKPKPVKRPEVPHVMKPQPEKLK